MKTYTKSLFLLENTCFAKVFICFSLIFHRFLKDASSEIKFFPETLFFFFFFSFPNFLRSDSGPMGVGAMAMLEKAMKTYTK